MDEPDLDQLLPLHLPPGQLLADLFLQLAKLFLLKKFSSGTVTLKQNNFDLIAN